MDAIAEPVSRDVWAKRINDDWDEARERYFSAGDNLIAAKAALPHGEFLMMVDADLAFQKRTAQRLMRIAGDARLRNASTVTLLPTDVTALYEITRLSDDEFSEAVEARHFKPDMNKADVTRFRKNMYQAVNTAAADGCSVDDLHALVASGKKFGAISADPAWRYETWSQKGGGRAPDMHYGTMTLDEIKALPVAELAADDCALFLWVVDWLSPSQMEAVANAWGFTWSTRPYDWYKQNKNNDDLAFGNGKWTHNQSECVWLLTKGSPERFSATERQIIWDKRGDHSEKPDEFYESVRRLVGGPYLALFERQVRPGFVSWGNEIPRKDMELGL